MSKIKLILADMDGTFLNDQKQMPLKAEEIVRRCAKKGILFGIATGRHKNDLLKRFHQVNDLMCFVTLNGSYTFKNDEVYLETPLPKDMVLKWVQEFEEEGRVHIVLNGAKTVYFNVRDPRYMERINEYYVNYVNGPEWIEEAMKDEILQLSFCDLKNIEETHQRMQKYEGPYHTKQTGPIWADIDCANIHKDMAVDALQKKLGITREETLIFGDFYNDMEMMEYADHSVCMKNGCDDLKKICRYQTVYTNNEDGVIRVLEEMLENDGVLENMKTLQVFE